VPTIDLRAPRDGSEQALADLLQVPALAVELGERFAAAGHPLHLVGGSVRDLLLGRHAQTPDLDFTTDARPEQVQALARGWAQETWDVGIEFGTVGLARGGVRCEVTTYRSEHYDPASRNPQVSFGESLEGDLLRRDFTVNAMAVSVPELVFVDPFGGLRDLLDAVLRTPAPAVESFGDDPLRMMRAARFVATLGLRPTNEVLAAMAELGDRLLIVAPERLRDELIKTLLGPDPVTGLELLVDTGLADHVLPELPALKLSIDEHAQHKDVYAHTLRVLEQAIALESRLPGGGPDLVLRLAALLHDIGKPATKKVMAPGKVSFHKHEMVGARMARTRLKALRFPKDTVSAVTELVALHLRFHGYGEGSWTDSAVRRYVTDAGPQLERLHVLTRSDCTTRNQRKAARLAAAYDALEERISRLQEQEDLRAIRPELDGIAIMAVLGIPPGPLVGQAYAYLLEIRLDRGLLGRAGVEQELRRWAAARDLLPPAP
jgi:poly(A) polymerase